MNIYKREDSNENKLDVKKIGRNAIYNLIGYGVTVSALFLITPYALHMLGWDRFGIWALVSVVTTFATLTNFGFDQALVKFIAEEYANKNFSAIKKNVSTAFILYLISFGFGTILIYFNSEFLALKVFKINPTLLGEFTFVIRGIIIAFYIRSIFSVFRSTLYGIQRFDLLNIVLIITRILSAFGIFLFLRIGLGLKGLVYNNFIITIISLIFQSIFVVRILKCYPISFKCISIKHFKRLFNYSIKVFSSSIINLLHDPLIKIIISNFNTIRFVTFYEIGNRVPGTMKNFFASALEVILPASAVMNINKNSNNNALFYISIMRILFILAFPFYIIILIISKPFILQWLGVGYDYIAYSMQFLLGSSFLALTATPAVKIFMGIGQPRFLIYDSIIQLVAFIILVFPLYSLFGYFGILMAIVIGFICSNLFLNYFIIRILKIHILDFLKSLPIKPIFICSIFAIMAKLIIILIKENSWLFMISLFFIYYVVYLFLIVRLNLLNKYEKDVISQIFIRLHFTKLASQIIKK